MTDKNLISSTLAFAAFYYFSSETSKHEIQSPKLGRVSDFGQITEFKF